MMSQLVSARASNIDGLAWLREDFTYNKDGNVTDYDVTGSDSSSAATDYSYTNSGDSDIMAGATGNGAFTLANDLNGNTTKLPTPKTPPNAGNLKKKVLKICVVYKCSPEKTLCKFSAVTPTPFAFYFLTCPPPWYKCFV